MNIQPVVEGHGEVSALPVLLRRLRDEAGAFGVDINAPIRRARSELVRQTEVSRSVELARRQEYCGAILLLIDSDDDCPAVLGPLLQRSAQAAARDMPCQLVLANREYEAWFLAAIESRRGLKGIRQDSVSHPNPEQPRDAKGEIEIRMHAGRSYAETADQAAMSARFDLVTTYRKCRSFRKLIKSFGQLVRDMGQSIDEWPPAPWFAEAP